MRARMGSDNKNNNEGPRMGRRTVGVTSGGCLQRLEANRAAVRSLIDSGSPCLVRDMLGGSAVPGGFKRKYPVPSIGSRSGKITVTGYVIGKQNGLRALVVRCDCDPREYLVDQCNFKTFRSTRCDACAKKAARDKRFWLYAAALPDDEHRRRLLNRFAAAINRCHNATDASFRNYGGRGISVYDGWRTDRAAFLRYIQTLHGWDNPKLDMDRIDTNGNYAPGNLRFISRGENTRNRRQVAVLEAEIARLRSEVNRLQAQVHHMEQQGAAAGS